MSGIQSLRIKLFADGADLDGIRKLATLPHIAGFTTNPSLMKKAGVTDYGSYARQVQTIIGDRPISLEVFADDLPTMGQQARTIAGWGANIYVKVPVANTQGVSTAPLIRELSAEGIKLNVTALFTPVQIKDVVEALDPATPAVLSVFAGRMADVGVDPLPTIRAARDLMGLRPQAELLWAATREVYNIFQAQESGCQIITVPNDILGKLDKLGRPLELVCRDTVTGFYNDARSAGFTI